MTKARKIAVIFGGCSPEYSVSLQSAHAVICAMDKLGLEPVLIGITREGDWFHFCGTINKILNDTWHNTADCFPAAISPNRSDHAILEFRGDIIRKIPVDAAFPVLHGKNGEDGTVQGMLELTGIPVVGCGLLASALCMDKDRAHKLVQAAGITVPCSFTLKRSISAEGAYAQAKKIGYPLFVKPVKAGSSFGVTKVTSESELLPAIELAFMYDDTVIVEECISGFEVGCAVLGTEELTVGEVDEIELTNGFFDYTEKYTLKTSAIHVPARIDHVTAGKIKETAKKVYRTLDCRGLARVDLFLSDSGEIVFNEVNTIPGFTEHSRYPNMMKAIGMTFETIISTVIELAIKG